MTWHETRTRIGNERGSVLLLGIAFIGITLLAIAVVTDASAMFRQHRALTAIADGAAIAGSQGLDIATYYERGATTNSALDPSRVSAIVNRFLATTSSTAPIRLEHLSSHQGVVRVELSAPIQLTFFPNSVTGPMRATGVARLDYRGEG